MLNRRESVFGGLLTIMWGAAGCSCAAHADGYEEGSTGCMLEDDEAVLVFARSTPAQIFATGEEKPIKSSGDKDLDYALARTLSRLSQAFGVMPGFAYFDGPKSNNAYATTKTLLNKADGTVMFGLPYLAKKLKQPEAPDAWVAATCAHEYAHILQYKLRLKNTVFAGQPTSKRLEMHADFLAGYFAGLSKRRDPNYPAAVYATSRYASGDFNTHKKGHHGTPDERAGATVRGFEVAYRDKKPLNEAVQIGIKYVSKV